MDDKRFFDIAGHLVVMTEKQARRWNLGGWTLEDDKSARVWFDGRFLPIREAYLFHGWMDDLPKDFSARQVENPIA